MYLDRVRNAGELAEKVQSKQHGWQRYKSEQHSVPGVVMLRHGQQGRGGWKARIESGETLASNSARETRRVLARVSHNFFFQEPA